MIIRSQDKKAIVNLNNVDSICTEHNVCEFDVVCYNGLQESKLKIGAYSTEEKAIKVLDMICNRYQAIWDVENGCICGGGINFSSVFQMPQDSEV